MMKTFYDLKIDAMVEKYDCIDIGCKHNLPVSAIFKQGAYWESLLKHSGMPKDSCEWRGVSKENF